MSRTQVPARAAVRAGERRLRGARLGLRVDGRTKKLIARAARVERRNLTDFCLTALTEAAEKAIARERTLVLSDRDREAFFDALVRPPKPSARLKRAFRDEREHIAP